MRYQIYIITDGGEKIDVFIWVRDIFDGLNRAWNEAKDFGYLVREVGYVRL